MISRATFSRIALVAVVLALFLAPGWALAQEQQEQMEDVLVRVHGTVDLAAGDSVDILVAVNSPAQVAGTVRDTLVIVNETATLSGEVGRDVFVWNGSLRLEPSARIGGDVILISGVLDRADGAEIGGTVEERSGASLAAEMNRVTEAVSLAAWLGMTLLLVAVALGWAAIGGRQLSGVAGLLGARPWLSAGTAAIFWILLPFVVFLAFVTVVGLPIGLALLLVVAPLLWGLGYVVAGTRLGFFIDDLRRVTPELAHPYLEAVLGVAILQLVALIPFVGGIVAMLAGLFGAGAILVHLWRRVGAARHQADAPVLDPAA